MGWLGEFSSCMSLFSTFYEEEKLKRRHYSLRLPSARQAFCSRGLQLPSESWRETFPCTRSIYGYISHASKGKRCLLKEPSWRCLVEQDVAGHRQLLAPFIQYLYQSEDGVGDTLKKRHRCPGLKNYVVKTNAKTCWEKHRKKEPGFGLLRTKVVVICWCQHRNCKQRWG